MKDHITAKFQKKTLKESSNEQPDYLVYTFSDIIDGNGKKYVNAGIKENKIMKAVNFQKGETYNMILSSPPYSDNSIRLPWAKEISWSGGRVYLKGGNKIVKEYSDGKEENLTISVSQIARSINKNRK